MELSRHSVRVHTSTCTCYIHTKQKWTAVHNEKQCYLLLFAARTQYVEVGLHTCNEKLARERGECRAFSKECIPYT